jgi:hypothetical protein
LVVFPAGELKPAGSFAAGRSKHWGDIELKMAATLSRSENFAKQFAKIRRASRSKFEL